MKTKQRNGCGAIFFLLVLLGACALAFLQVSLPGRVPVLVYHCVGDNSASPAGDALYVSERTFARQMAFLQRMGFQSVFAGDLDKPLPLRPIVITFDDGYANNFSKAFPILERYGMKATIFTVGADNDRGRDGRLTWEEMRTMEASGLVEIQSHTYDLHTIDAQGRFAEMPLTQEKAQQWQARIVSDLTKQRAAFERELGHAPTALAYPNGWYDAALDELYARNGLVLRFTIEPHTAQADDIWRGQVPRIPVFSWTRLPEELLIHQLGR